jgi:hypothetical protein
VIDKRGDRIRLLVDDTVDLQAILARAAAVGSIRRFSYEPPALSELFMEAVQPAEPTIVANGAA